ncbi:MAG: ATP-binding protein [Muribaculaceae bacterium]|nr:ATP-binding protein [Muribaculaceae bacterium]
MTFIPRILASQIEKIQNRYQVIVITGPRQTGKTTLALHLFPDFPYFNLEDPTIRELVEADPRAFINNGPDNIIIDEIQRFPTLFSYIQVCVDAKPQKKFIITGSSDFLLMEKITQSLAGRAALFTLLPFSFKEVESYIHSTGINEIILNGFYPGVLAKGIEPRVFYANYYATYVERDARQINSIDNLDSFRLFIKILAGRVGSEFNANALSAEIGVSAPTIRKWLGILKTSYIAFSLPPYFANIEKRLTKTPKVYFYDTGLLCYLLGITSPEILLTHPLRGQIFENLAIAQMVKEKYNSQAGYELCFYRENGAREVDLLKIVANDIFLYEIKSSSTFHKDFRKNLIYLENLLGDKIKGATVVYDGPSLPPVAINVKDI